MSSTVLAPLTAIDLPIPGTVEPAARGVRDVEIRLNDNATLTVASRTVAVDALIATLQNTHGDRREVKILLSAHKASDYADVARVLEMLRQAGYTRVALVSR